MPPGRRLSVLIVEDDDALRSLYATVLRQSGYMVFDVEDGLSALHLLEVTKPAAVVLDLQLPRVSGLDVYHEMRAHSKTRDIPVVIVTGSDVSDLKPAAPATVLKKPIPPQRLLMEVDRCVGHITGAGA